MKKIILFVLLIPSLCFADGNSENTIGGYTASAHLIQVAGRTLSPSPYLDFPTATGDTLGGVTHVYPASSGGSGIIVSEQNGTNYGTYTEIIFPNGSTTNNGDGSITIAFTPSSGGDMLLEDGTDYILLENGGKLTL